MKSKLLNKSGTSVSHIISIPASDEDTCGE